MNLILIPRFSLLVITFILSTSLTWSCVSQWGAPDCTSSRYPNSQLLLCVWYGIYNVKFSFVFCCFGLLAIWLMPYVWYMLGWWPYPSNGRRKHWSHQHWESRLHSNRESSANNFLLVSNLNIIFFSGEFTMIELAETVKEVSCFISHCLSIFLYLPYTNETSVLGEILLGSLMIEAVFAAY